MKKAKSLLIFLGVVLLVSVGAFSLLKCTVSTHNEVDLEKSDTAKAASSRKVPKQDISLVGLGDSLTHGVGDPENKGGYVHMIKQKLNKEHNVSVTTNNFGKTGDRSDQIEKRVETSKKLQDALEDADVITMTVGGNDLMQVMQNNFMALAANKLDKVMPKEEEKYDAKLSSLFAAVRKYNSKAPIFLISVYNPFYVYFPNLTPMQEYTEEWNKIAESHAEKDDKMEFVDVCDQLSEGQYYGHSKKKLKQEANSDLSELSNQKLETALNDKSEKNDYLSDADHFHPNKKGYRYMTSRLYEVMEKHEDLWLKKGNE